MEKKLCLGCFSDQHIAKNCKEWQTCKTCKRPHPTSLHDYDWAKKISNDSDNQPGAEPRVRSNRTAICNVTEAGDVPINMGILTVHLFHKSDPAKKIKVYALLENASGGTFVSEKSMKALSIEGNDTDRILTTIHGTSSVTTKALEGLVVAIIKEEDVILDLPRTFTRHVIPAHRNEIPRPDVICKMSHLKKISAEISPPPALHGRHRSESAYWIELPKRPASKRNRLRQRFRPVCSSVTPRMVHQRAPL